MNFSVTWLHTAGETENRSLAIVSPIAPIRRLCAFCERHVQVGKVSVAEGYTAFASGSFRKRFAQQLTKDYRILEMILNSLPI
jgi:hypothetical protein